MLQSANLPNPGLLDDIEAHLAGTGMGAHYFGKKACGISEVVPRLRRGGRVWPETEARIRAYMAANPPSQKDAS